jgi:Uncharacterized protein conserved in bacteria (DUF2252)
VLRCEVACLRGSAAVMVADLALTLRSDIRVQACGDCHLSHRVQACLQSPGGRLHCSPARQGSAIVTGLYLVSFTVIPDTARRKSTPCPTPVRLMTTPLSFRIDDAPIPPPTVPAAVAATYVPSKSLTFFKL